MKLDYLQMELISTSQLIEMVLVHLNLRLALILGNVLKVNNSLTLESNDSCLTFIGVCHVQDQISTRFRLWIVLASALHVQQIKQYV